jgi:hypothetical protein
VVADDQSLQESHVQALRAYYDEQVELGRSHPFLTEAMADQTDDAGGAVELYQLALEQAQTIPE